MLGSSPRVWGQEMRTRTVPPFYGIIPTRVGTRGYFRSLEVTRKDHPHACGDKLPFARYTVSARIIPTRVGTRLLDFAVYQSKQDHPHACGDKIHSLFGISFFVGSSPRVWGQDHHRVRYGDGVRIIPTRVGTSHYCQL